MTRFARAVLLILAGSLLPMLANAAPDGGTPETPLLVVFFPDWSGALDQAAMDVVRQASRRIKQTPHAHVLVAGYADSTGTKAADLALTQLRARRVADALEADGISSTAISVQAEGAQRTHGVASRRVEITISGP